jgi:hypothetical protein
MPYDSVEEDYQKLDTPTPKGTSNSQKSSMDLVRDESRGTGRRES